MAVFTHIETDSGTNADISSATAIGAYTATADKLVMVDVSIDQVAGDGDYVMYVTRQINGAGSAYKILPKTTMAAASGDTAISAQSGWITVRNGDVLTVYVDGLAGDTSTPDWSTRWFEDSGTAGVAVASIATDAITAASLKADAITEITDDIFAEVIENSLSYKQVIQVMAAVLAGKVTGGATGTITFKDLADAVNRVVMTVDASGNRSAVTTNFS